MSIELRGWNASAPDGAVIGVIGDGDALLADIAAAGARRMGMDDALDFSPAPLVVLDHALARRDALDRARAAAQLETLRRAGTTVFLASQEEALLERMCDEIWWVRDGAIAAKGDPREVLSKYRADVAARFVEWGLANPSVIVPAMRRGDGRAEIIGLETLDAQDRPTMVWASGEPVSVRVTLQFRDDIDNPVVGMMIRTRIGLEVYGTNTELEKLPLGLRKAGTTLRVVFSFNCELCAQEYTLTAASHDADGTPHDWLDDAVAFSVADSRYTAGVANLRASVRAE
jgi:Wzt C-terminal domain